MTSEEMRNDPLFMRNLFVPDGKWGPPLIKKQEFDIGDTKLIACSDTISNETEKYKKIWCSLFCR